MERRREPELLDGERLDERELEDSLREVWFVNRYLGGNPVLFRHLRSILDGADRKAGPVRVLDVATGIADVPLALQAWGSRRRLDLSLVGIDLHPQMVAVARKRTAERPGIVIEQADARSLPYPDGSFDAAICNLALHHLDEPGAVQLLRELTRVTRRGWVVADLERRPAAYWSARLLARLVWRNPLTRHDGPLSVQRAFTRPEAEAIVREAGVPAVVHRHFPFRLAVVSHG
ncbi:demethylmenaquinone methyltransferase [Paenibacillus sp. J31TS4]|uniref:methyltransferase domain-containing protein n=1 Tax=Paenibacillus sp. J31TS4 TaxID=2807195 RepID=UPI001B14513B|nr:methyltransferase domain-containing protein [Paenibacillus sp. J31TS4]GIP38396.1 demethylmenaquinone methyltransferase [Paenibacillus sp. J31TS4]